jgi:hypothetical protein
MVMLFTAMTAFSWASTSAAISQMGMAACAPFICVGIAYFLIAARAVAVVDPWADQGIRSPAAGAWPVAAAPAPWASSWPSTSAASRSLSCRWSRRAGDQHPVSVILTHSLADLRDVLRRPDRRGGRRVTVLPSSQVPPHAEPHADAKPRRKPRLQTTATTA